MTKISLGGLLALCLLTCSLISCSESSPGEGSNRSWKIVAKAPAKAVALSPKRMGSAKRADGLSLENGWFVHSGRAVWGFAHHNGWWGGYGARMNITRRGPGRVGPGQTEDLDRLTDAMATYGFPGFEHNFGLWYDRRRDKHDVSRRLDAKAMPPFLEQPWARSHSGVAWDGLPKYDLVTFNDWYFSRLRTFAELSEQKGTILLFNFYMQHALLEFEPHYVDFPWRPVNAVQDTGMPNRLPAANAFYDVSHEGRRGLHRVYIEKCLDELAGYSSVIFLLSQEYTGPREFVEFWLDTVLEWEARTGKRVTLSLGATKEVMDAVLTDPKRGSQVSVLDLRYWWLLPNGQLYAPPGGREIPGRYVGGYEAAKTTPERIYEQVLSYRLAFPNRAILHTIYANVTQTWAFLMAGGSLLVRPLDYPDIPEEGNKGQHLSEYTAPWEWKLIQPIYVLIQGPLAELLPTMRPCPDRVNEPSRNWCLAGSGQTFLIYIRGGESLVLDVADVAGLLVARWIDPSVGSISVGAPNIVSRKEVAVVNPPDKRDWLLWLQRAPETNLPTQETPLR